MNEKNSWSLDLIDHMGRDINEASGDGGQGITNFQRAAGTLEAGIKIYSYRVDSVYTETFKLMGGLNRTSKRDGQGEEEEEGGEADATEEDGVPKQKKEKEKVSKRVATAFLESNPANLCLKKLEMSFDVDPLFHQTSAKFDEGGAKGLLLHNLPVQDGCAIVFDSCDAERPTAATQPPAAAPKLPLSCISNLLPRNFLELHISSEFSQRHEPAACDWASAADGSARVIPEHEASAPDEEEEGAEEGGAAEDEAASFDDDVPFDEPPDNEDDDGFAGDGPVDGRDELLHQAQHGDEDGRLAILSVDEMVAEHEGDVAQGAGKSAEEEAHEKAQQMLCVGQRWAGPAHWKFHAAPKPREAGGGGGGGGGRGGGKAPFVMDFSRRAEALQRINEMPLESKGTTLSDAALSKATEAENTLPVDCHYTVDDLRQLFHKPAVRVRRGRACVQGAEMLMGRRPGDGPKQAWAEAGGSDQADDDGCGEEAPDFGDDWADGGGPEASTEGEPPAGAADAGGAFDLVAQPTRVEKIEIGYAKVAKQVDISGLKSSLWDLLSEGGSSGERVNGAVSFQQVVARLTLTLTLTLTLALALALTLTLTLTRWSRGCRRRCPSRSCPTSRSRTTSSACSTWPTRRGSRSRARRTLRTCTCRSPRRRERAGRPCTRLPGWHDLGASAWAPLGGLARVPKVP